MLIPQEGMRVPPVVAKRPPEAVGAAEQTASASLEGRIVGGSEVVVQKRMLGEQGELQGGERGVGELDDDDLGRRAQPSELPGRHRFLFTAGLGFGA